MAIVVVATVFNYLLNVYMIPKYGPMGAAVVSLATIALVGTCYIVASRPFFVLWVFNLHHAVPLVLSLLMTFLLWQLRTNGMWYIAAPVGVAYCALVYVTGFTKEERRLVFARSGVSAI
jgi:O-antigen/teichoic acid export membrane protein